MRYTKPDGTPFYAVTIETDEGIYLVKIKVKTDNAEALERWLEGEEDAENEEVAGTSGVSDGSTLPTTTSPNTAPAMTLRAMPSHDH